MVLEHPAMALVVFGMGGLIRFRTRTGSGLGTGRAIFAVVIGFASNNLAKHTNVSSRRRDALSQA